MSCVRDHCRCCYSAEALEALQPPILDVFKLIRIPQDVKIDDYPAEACFKCHNFLKEVHRFRRKCHAVDEIFRNNLQDIKHEVELILKKADDEFPDVHNIKQELSVEFEEIDQIDVQINKIEADSGSECSLDRFETYPEDPLVLIDEIDCPSDNPELKKTKNETGSKKTKQKRTLKTNKKSTADADKSSGEVVKKTRKPYKKKYSVDKPFQCELCSYRCEKASNMEIHLRRHRGEKPFSCDLCNYSCAAKSNMLIHFRNKHSDNRPYACDQCDYRSKVKASLITHKKQHSDIRDYICELCPYSTFEMVNLKYHIRSAHTGERPYICDRCPYRTMRPENLRIHIKRHDNYKKIACSECSYVTSSEKNLKEHMTKHTGNKLQCHLCTSTFTTNNSYKRHLRNQHAIPRDQIPNLRHKYKTEAKN